MWMNLLLLIGGLALILIGANGLTDGAASVAKRFRISDLVIGLTIVASGPLLLNWLSAYSPHYREVLKWLSVTWWEVISSMY